MRILSVFALVAATAMPAVASVPVLTGAGETQISAKDSTQHVKGRKPTPGKPFDRNR